ncbi:MAG TPA: FCD domain-containing protein [Candidatus Sulfotelmatobacter sp.]|jgi:GntR family transcriptional repressor for pyruvate dehydrogenase complex|nr:FCD domain-containing protein [Candidatus Sulfotelmatobacter sp.]
MPETADKPPYPETLAALFQAHPESAFDYLEFRLTIARMAARLAAERATEEDRAAMTRAFQALCKAHETHAGDAENQTDAEFHLSIYKACHNAVMAFIMGTLISMQRRNVFYDRKRLYHQEGARQEGAREILMQQHRALYDAIMARDGAAASEAAETHIRYANATLRESVETQRRLQVSIRRRRRADNPDGGPFGDPPASGRRPRKKP